MAMKIRKGDKVIVICGKDKDATGQVLRVLPKAGRVIVEGVNIVTHHERRRTMDRPGGIIKKEAPIHISNVMLIDKKTNERSRVGFRIQDGVKERVTKKSNEAI